jgi:ribosome maturation factor RimP
VLKSADDNGFTVSVSTKVKEEGAKRPKWVDVDHAFGYDDVKYTKYLIKF